jgi:hypothetical protein
MKYVRNALIALLMVAAIPSFVLVSCGLGFVNFLIGESTSDDGSY